MKNGSTSQTDFIRTALCTEKREQSLEMHANWSTNSNWNILV